MNNNAAYVARQINLTDASVTKVLTPEAHAFAVATIGEFGDIVEMRACALAFVFETTGLSVIGEDLASAVRDAYETGWITPAQALQISAAFVDEEQRASLQRAAKADAEGFFGWLHN